MKLITSYPGGGALPPLDPPEAKAQRVILSRNDRMKGYDFGIEHYVGASLIAANVSTHAVIPLVDAMRDIGYEIRTFDLEFVCQIGIDENINLSGYFESVEAETIFNRFTGFFNQFRYYLRSYRMEFIPVRQ